MDVKQRVAEMFLKAAQALGAEEQKFAVAALEGGQEIQTSAEAFAVGVDVYVVNDEGEQIPLPDGNYMLADGTPFVVQGGVIAEMGEAEAVEEAKEEEPVAAAEETLTREDVARMIDEAVAKVTENFAQQLQEKNEEIANLAKQPAAQGVQKLGTQKARPSAAELATLSEADRVRVLMSSF